MHSETGEPPRARWAKGAGEPLRGGRVRFRGFLSVPCEAGEDFEIGELAVQPTLTGRVHPIWHIVNDDKQNRDIVRSFPVFAAGNRLPRAKPNISTVLATATRGSATDLPAITVGHYGKGRSLALAGGIAGLRAGAGAAVGDGVGRRGRLGC